MFRKISPKQTRMSVQKVQNKLLEKTQQRKAVVHSQAVAKYHFSGKTSVDQTDSTLLWKTNFPLGINIRKRFITFRNSQYCISNWTGDDFPHIIYIVVDGINGYLKKTGQSSTRCVALELSEAQAVMDQSDVRTYQLKYTNRDFVTWQIDSTVLQIKVRILIDDIMTPVNLPLPNNMTFNLQLRAE